MHANHSFLVDAEYLKDVGCFTSLEVRRSVHESFAVIGSSLLSKQWERTYGEVPEPDKGAGSPAGHLAVVSFPECLAERIPILAYISDYILYHDDRADAIKPSEAKKEYEQLASSFEVVVKTDKTSTIPKRHAGIMDTIVTSLKALDVEGAKDLLGVYSGFERDQARGDQTFTSIAEYLPHRVDHAGYPTIVLAMVRFGANVKLDQASLDIAHAILEPLGFAFALYNDLCSWDKELLEFKDNPARQDPGDDGDIMGLVSAVTIIMRQYNISVEEAHTVMRLEILRYEQEYCDNLSVWKQRKDETSASAEVLRYVENAELAYSGCFLWHCTSPRYQLSAKNGE